MEKEVVEKFLGKFCKVEKRSSDPNNPNRNSFKLYCIIKEVTDSSVIIHTNHDGAILLDEIITIEELQEEHHGV